MFALLGILVVFAAVLGGYLLEHGNVYVLMQPAGLVIIAGAAAGIVLAANPPCVIGKMFRGVASTLRSPLYSRNSYLLCLRMLYELTAFALRAGIEELEQDFEAPAKSRILSNYPDFLADKTACDFVCDSMRMLVIGSTTAQDLDRLMDLDIDVQRRGHHEPVAALSSMADALPGLGIVAAVLGVVISMQAIGGAASTVGAKIAAAMVGTFLGILLCYGVVGPVATRLEHGNERRIQFLEVMRTGIVAFARGTSPLLAAEYARRSIPVEIRPSFEELEQTIRRTAKIPPLPNTTPPEAKSAQTGPA